MSLIPVQDVFDRLIRVPHGRHHLLALGSFDAHVIGAVHDEQGSPDLIDVEQIDAVDIAWIRFI